MKKHTISFPDVPADDPEEAKQMYRAVVREHRKMRSEASREKLGTLWASRTMEFIGTAQTVACYVSVNSEPSTYALCEALERAGRTLLLPKLGPRLTRAWGFFRGLDDLEQLAPGRPPEPSGESLSNDVLGDVEVMIIPGLLVSQFGERIGQGGGWYDRALKAVNHETRIATMVYPEEYVDFHLPNTELDVPVRYALTPYGLFETSVK